MINRKTNILAFYFLILIVYSLLIMPSMILKDFIFLSIFPIIIYLIAGFNLCNTLYKDPGIILHK